MKKITLNGLKKVLTPKELKNILGGSEGLCSCGGTGDPVYNVYYSGCYYDGIRCHSCGTITVNESTARCIATP